MNKSLNSDENNLAAHYSTLIEPVPEPQKKHKKRMFAKIPTFVPPPHESQASEAPSSPKGSLVERLIRKRFVGVREER